MRRLLVLENPRDWPLHVPGVEVVPARTYLTDPGFSQTGPARVFNLCKSYRYQSLGYYVSLIAAARGHKPIPAVLTIQDLKTPPTVRVVAEDIEELIRSSLRALRSDEFDLSIYFGSNVAKRYDRLSRALYNQFPAPFLRASFARRAGVWELESIRAIDAGDIPPEHHEFVLKRATEYFARTDHHRRKRREPRYDIAVLRNPHEAHPPSDERALRRFARVAEWMDCEVDILDKDELYGRLAEFDALFIRETTSVNHHTYRIARRAAAEGLVVIDDPESILRCSNKVYLAELLERHGVPTPRTAIISRETADTVQLSIGFPCVLKQPDSSFSKGVIKVENETQLGAELDRLFRVSELLLVQEFVPTPFDWRVGILDREPLFVCRYHMARHHWQIAQYTRQGSVKFGRVETLAVEQAPRDVVRTAVRAAGLVGDGFYGVDIKELDPAGRPVVIEINDNPNVEAGEEDSVLGHELYRKIVRVFIKRIEAMRQ